MIRTKGAHQGEEFQTFDCSREISPNLYFEKPLLLKVYKISAKKVQRSLSHDTKEWCKIWRKTNLLFQKWQELCEFWFKNSNLRNFHFDWSLLCKVSNVWLKKAHRSHLSWQWNNVHNLKRNWLVVWEKTWRIWQIFTRPFGNVRLGLLWDPFVQSTKCIS